MATNIKNQSKSPCMLNWRDLSYNQFSGVLPTWLNDNQNLKVNLVGNYFKVKDTDNGVVTRRLGCLQRSFPCNRGTPLHSQFAVNCGGQQKTSAREIVFERDDETLNAASFYVSDTQTWGVSNTGAVIDNSLPYVTTSQSEITNTLDSELFQTARLSPSSLRYYGLGLENGAYNVSLQFAEIQIEGNQGWSRLGRRIFDVYVQGRQVLQDFNILMEAGGPSTAIEKSFKANVTENFLEIHFFWSGKGTCCIPARGTYGPLVSAISVTPEFTPTVNSNSPKNTKTGTVIGIVIGSTVAALICLIVIIFLMRRKIRKLSSGAGVEEDEALRSIAAKPNIFSYTDMKIATRDFDPDNKLGEGGFGVVYKGVLPDGEIVAVKQLSSESKQGQREFINEVAAISVVQHRNLVKLHGCCIEGDRRLLVYEYLENNSLAYALFDADKSQLQLDWPTRYNICIGTARGLAYLHEESRIRIVHRDIKASNILLDEDLNPKIADFGLAKLYDEKKTHISTRVAGTVGYLAPEYAMRGHLTEKADVFSFGVVALELVSGRSNTQTSLPQDMVYLLEWTWHLHEQNRLQELMDPDLVSTYSEEEVIRVIEVALLCTQASPTMRPPMSRVVAMLTGDAEVIPVTSRPGYITDWEYSNVLSGAKSTENATTQSSTGRSTVISQSSPYALSSPENVTRSLIHSSLEDGSTVISQSS
eukprot:Gb_19701 [translate_table: standard]